MKSWKLWSSYLQSAVTLAMFIGIAAWGHHTHWQFTLQHAEEHAESESHPGQPAAPDGQLSLRGNVGADQHGIELAPVRQQIVRDVVSATATITYNGQRYSQVSTRADGHVQQLFVRVGQSVRKGQVLALVDSREVGEAKSNWLQKLMAVHYQRSVLERLQSTGEGVIPLSKIRAVEADLRLAEVESFVAQQRLVNLGFTVDMEFDLNAPLEQLANQMRYLGIPDEVMANQSSLPATANLIAICAPFDGVVAEQHAVPGEMVSTEDWQFVVADTSSMWVKLAVRREDASRLTVGQAVELMADGVSEPLRTRLAWINPEINMTTQTIEAGCEIVNPLASTSASESGGGTRRLLQANQFGHAKIFSAERKDAVVVPATAVQRMPDLSHVAFVADPTSQSYQRRVIRLGNRQDGVIEVVEGVQAGEWVVTDGSFILKSELMKASLVGG